ncbi:MAG: hypothetical protein AABZ57_05615, partial [Candidatus Margulisiibacteriota bacterium]
MKFSKNSADIGLSANIERRNDMELTDVMVPKKGTVALIGEGGTARTRDFPRLSIGDFRPAVVVLDSTILERERFSGLESWLRANSKSYTMKKRHDPAVLTSKEPSATDIFIHSRPKDGYKNDPLFISLRDEAVVINPLSSRVLSTDYNYTHYFGERIMDRKDSSAKQCASQLVRIGFDFIQRHAAAGIAMEGTGPDAKPFAERFLLGKFTPSRSGEGKLEIAQGDELALYIDLLENGKGKTAVSLSPHADDGVLGAGAQLIKFSMRTPRWKIFDFVLTSGRLGITDEYVEANAREILRHFPNAGPERDAAKRTWIEGIRAAELGNSDAVLGVDVSRLLGYPFYDNRLSGTKRIVSGDEIDSFYYTLK